MEQNYMNIDPYIPTTAKDDPAKFIKIESLEDNFEYGQCLNNDYNIQYGNGGMDIIQGENGGTNFLNDENGGTDIFQEGHVGANLKDGSGCTDYIQDGNRGINFIQDENEGMDFIQDGQGGQNIIQGGSERINFMEDENGVTGLIQEEHGGFVTDIGENEPMGFLQNEEKSLFDHSDSDSSSGDEEVITSYLKSGTKNTTLEMNMTIYEKCEVCDKVFKSPWKYITHMQTHDLEQLYSCPECGLRCHDRKLTKKHFRGHLVDAAKNMKLFECTQCDAVFNTLGKFKTHLSTHPEICPYKCGMCDKTFKYSIDLREHFSIHTGEKQHSCDICGKSFHIPSKLKTHMKSHTGERPFKCLVCGKSFPEKCRLTQHMYEHTGEKRYKCFICKRSFYACSELKEHMEIHNDGKPHSCDICGKCFIVPSKLKAHMITHTGERPFECGVCGKGFTENGKLTRHMRTHTGEKPYKCSVCEKSFNVSSNLKKHMEIHNGIKPFVCPICSRGFTQKANLKAHLRIHTGEQNLYTCEKCGQRFYKKVQLKNHDCSGKLSSEDKKALSSAVESEVHNILNVIPSPLDSAKSETRPCDFKGLNADVTDVLESVFNDNEILNGISKDMLGMNKETDDLKSILPQDSAAYQPIAMFYEKFPCNHCGKSFESVADKKEHEKEHNARKSFSCLECGKAFVRGRSLEEHMTIHKRGLPFTCKTCGKGFSYESTLNDHMKDHGNTRPYECDICGRCFSQKGNMKSHRRIHTGETTPYSCDVCSEKFKILRDLKRHDCNKETTAGHPKKKQKTKNVKKKLSEEDIVKNIRSRKRSKNDLHVNEALDQSDQAMGNTKSDAGHQNGAQGQPNLGHQNTNFGACDMSDSLPEANDMYLNKQDIKTETWIGEDVNCSTGSCPNTCDELNPLENISESHEKWNVQIKTEVLSESDCE